MYNYQELLANATAFNATQEDINRLGAWFEQYGNDSWNGEYFDADGQNLYRIEQFNPDTDCYDIVGYEFRL